MSKEITQFKSDLDLKKLLATEYMKQIQNFFGDEKQALRFLSGVMAAVQRTPKLLACTPLTVVNSFMTMAQLGLMPSDVSGEAYVMPYKNKGVSEAQFQLGYKGLVTLFYRSGAVKDIVAEIVYEKDQFEYVNGVVDHRPDVFLDDRGPAKGAYVIIRLMTGGSITKVMSKKDILEIASKFSKSYYQWVDGKQTSHVSASSPWSEKNDPQLWMWRKTVLIQAAKLVPKNETIMHAIAEDYKDSKISDKPELIEAPDDVTKALTMGHIQKEYEDPNNTTEGTNNTTGDAPNADGLSG